jgi:selenocysteine lyase/cysteine desulfurase
MGGTGIGIVAMSDRALGVLRPAALGWRSIDHWKDVTHMLDYRLDLPDEARRFEPGMLNFPGMILLEQSLGLILEVGMPEIERRVLELTARLCDGLVARGYHPVSARGAGEGSGIVAFEPAGVRPTSVADLYARRIVVSGREGRIRVSPHFYNTAEEVDALLDALP